MQFDCLLDGMIILKAYMDDPSAYHTSAEHDEFFVQVDRVPTAEDQKRLEVLGWMDDDFGTEGLGWKAFT